MSVLRNHTACAAAVFLASLTTHIYAQEVPESPQQRMDRLEQQFRELDVKYQQELKKRDEQIAELRNQIRTTQEAAATQPSQHDIDFAIERVKATQQITQEIMRDQAQRRSPLDDAIAGLALPSSSTAPSASSGNDILSRQVGGANLRLIDISFDVLVAGGGSTFNDEELSNLQGGGHDPRKNGFTLQNAELSLSGAVDPYFGAEAHIVYTIDPLTGETVVELEEAFLTTQELPYNLQLKAGMFQTEFGRMNPRHPHTWAWMDQPVINTRLFGPDGMRGVGARLSWLVPVPWFSEFYAGLQNANGETMASFLSSDASFEERAIGGRPFVDRNGNAFNSLAYLVRWENGFDLNKEWNAAIGVSGLFGPNATGPSGRTFIYGTDLTLKWQPESTDRGFPYFVWQSEVMGRSYKADAFNDGTVSLAGATLSDWGFYTQALYGIAPGWRGGLRLEYASGGGDSVGGRNNDPFRDDRYRVSPLIEWLPSEFSRVRFQVNYDHADHLFEKDGITFWVGFEFLIGAHAAHRY